MQSGLNAYQRNDILGKSQLDLLLKVYDGAIAAYTAADEAYRREAFDDGYEQIEKAKKFVTHLYTTLDLEQGGEVAENLSRLYAFVLSQTDVAEATKDSKIIAGNIKILRNLREGWEALKAQVGGAQAEPAAPAAATQGFATSG